MGMTDRQFVAFRKLELDEYKELLEIAKETKAAPAVITRIERIIEKARTDIEA